MARILWIATGLAWAFRSVLAAFDPQYYDPVTNLDHLAVWSFSVALLLTAPTVVLLALLVRSPVAVVVAAVSATGALLAAAANFAEDGFGVSAAGTGYIVGVLVMWLGLVVLTIVAAVARRGRLAVAFGLCVVGLALFNVAGGGILVLAVLVALATRRSWFSGDRPSPKLSTI